MCGFILYPKQEEKCTSDFFLRLYLQVTLDIVRADITAAEEQNTTETTKTFKVNCDKRNITGIDSFTVQVLNASQVFTPASEFP